MKHLKYFYIFLAFAYGMTSCSDMDHTYKQYIEKGPIIYLGNLSTFHTNSGYERVKISWGIPTDPRAKYLDIYWDNNKQSITNIPLIQNEEGNIIIDKNRLGFPLEEGDYAFYIISHNGELGHQSLKKEVLVKVYGQTFRSYLQTQTIAQSSYETQTGALALKLNEMNDDRFLGTMIKWKNDSVFMKNSEQALDIPNFKRGSSIEYYTCYLPDSTCLDTLQTDRLIFRPNINVPLNNTSQASDPVKGILSCDKPSTSGFGTNINNLLDDKSTSYFSTNPNVAFPHNFTVDLSSSSETLRSFRLYYKVRPGNTDGNPTHIAVYASNGERDQNNEVIWNQKCVELQTSDGLPVDPGKEYYTDWFSCDFDIKYIRFEVLDVLKDPTSSGRACMLDEFRIYQ